MSRHTRRGRPKRGSTLAALHSNAHKELAVSHSAIHDLDVKKPIAVLQLPSTATTRAGQLNQRKSIELLENTQNTLARNIELAKLPQVHYTKQQAFGETTQIEDEEDSDYRMQQQYQEDQLLAQYYQMQKHNDNPQDAANHYREILKQSQLYKRPENHYIHYNEPSDVELYDIVEYDMDEQDQCWLQLYNKERRKESLDDVSPFLFECIMDKLEKEWLNLIKNAPKPITEDIVLPEDSACAVCDDTEVENSNAIVFCDGCNVAVHQECYGIPYIPEGQWLCRKCMISPENPVSCLFCPNEGGAFKQTNTNQWGHLLCAIWIPEVGVGNPIYMEPIEMIENIPKSRWKLTCSICRIKEGACIQCDNKHCFLAFHVTCAKTAGLCMKMNNVNESDGVVLKAYCQKHTPREHIQQTRFNTVSAMRHTNEDDYQEEEEEVHVNSVLPKKRLNAKDHKIARAHQHQYSTGAPIAPDLILQKIDRLPWKITSISQCSSSLLVSKRESRRGAPLLKRLHLEPWTAVSKHDEDMHGVKAQFVSHLRTDLEKIRMLSEQVQKRERLKLERTRKQKAYLEMILFPLEHVARPLLEELIEKDRKRLFYHPVQAKDEPQYHTIIKKPMCFSIIEQKLNLHKYQCLSDFLADLQLIWENAMRYNPLGTSHHKVASKLKTASLKLFPLAEERMSRFELLENGIWNQPMDDTIFDYEKLDDDDEEEEIESSDDKPMEVEMITPSPEKVYEQQQEGKEPEKEIKAEQEVILNQLDIKSPSSNNRQKEEVNADSKKTKKRRHSGSITTPAPRLTRSAGLEASIQEFTKRAKISHEARTLFASYNGVSHLNRPTESYKENRKKPAPIGWVYLEDEEEEEEEEENDDHNSESSSVYHQQGGEQKRTKPPKPKRNDMPIPNFNRGEIVWARVTGYPSHPAKFLNYSDEEAGPKLVANRRYAGDVLVEFLKVPEMHRYGWVGRHTICEMGDPNVDRAKLMEALKQKTRRPAFIQEAKEGYRCAGSILGLDPEPLLKSVFDTAQTPKRHQKKNKH
ncbi:PHD-zinc-finger like domain-containing protein [Choanephora cucurbitarum]|nr:PHD-zinc-finger like domain-containing protein [Choanephora cucurbitarum]